MWRIVIAALGAIILAFGGAFVYWERPSGKTVVSPIATGTSVEAPSFIERSVPEGSREYRNDTYHVSLFYPQELSVAERAESGGAMTITFQNEKEVKGFQVFIVPYAEPQVSEARFRQDEPSGVRTNVRNATIDGATAAAFYSTNAALGDTAEIWFVHGGYLYEVTTLKPLDTWLSGIMQTWKFI